MQPGTYKLSGETHGKVSWAARLICKGKGKRYLIIVDDCKIGVSLLLKLRFAIGAGSSPPSPPDKSRQVVRSKTLGLHV